MYGMMEKEEKVGGLEYGEKGLGSRGKEKGVMHKEGEGEEIAAGRLSE